MLESEERGKTKRRVGGVGRDGGSAQGRSSWRCHSSQTLLCISSGGQPGIEQLLAIFLEDLEICRSDTPSKNSFGVRGTCTPKRWDSRSCVSAQKGTLLEQLQYMW